ncbi:ATPase [Mycolicibacterium sp. S2-37]|uniref:ATPase n=1 Tax=Mycolicibacterium sp. S2-37 TaxID=2810297 RepID=UPI001A94A801|nr:ATPase [Mycolicibacterium sp. S2-37]MBO0680131.1 ATPase [Mycolicibacterium sp. S2-37]
MRLFVAAVLAGCGLALIAPAPVRGQPMDCPPNCDRIPRSAWIAPTSIPLYDVYRWPELSGLSVTAVNPRFRFEEVCATPPAVVDARSWAVAARSSVTAPDGHWQLQAQVIHWRGETWRGGQTAVGVFDAALAAVRRCQLTAPFTSPSVTTAEPDRFAAVLSAPDRSVLHQYLLVDRNNSTVTELAMWSTSSPPQVPWPATPDGGVLDALAAPLCTAYIGSCR